MTAPIKILFCGFLLVGLAPDREATADARRPGKPGRQAGRRGSRYPELEAKLVSRLNQVPKHTVAIRAVEFALAEAAVTLGRCFSEADFEIARVALTIDPQMTRGFRTLEGWSRWALRNAFYHLQVSGTDEAEGLLPAVRLSLLDAGLNPEARKDRRVSLALIARAVIERSAPQKNDFGQPLRSGELARDIRIFVRSTLERTRDIANKDWLAQAVDAARRWFDDTY